MNSREPKATLAPQVIAELNGIENWTLRLSVTEEGPANQTVRSEK